MTLLFPTYDAYDRPGFYFKVLGQPASDIAAVCTEFKLTEGHLKKKEVNKLELTLADPDFFFDDDPRLESDVEWLVRWGYAHDLSRVHRFTFKFYEPVYDERGSHTKKLTLHGEGAELIRCKSARNWGTVTSSSIAQLIAKRHGLKTAIDESNDQSDIPYVQPSSVDDYGYLSQLASDIDFEFFIDNGVLTYRSRETAYGGDAYWRFVYGSPGSLLKDFVPEVKTPSSVNVQARAADTKAAEHTDVQPQVNNQNVGGQHLGSAVVPNYNKVDPAAIAKSNAVSFDEIKRDANNLAKRGQQLKIDLETGKAFMVNVPDAAAETVKTPETNAAKVKQITIATKRHFLDESVKARARFIGTPKVSRSKTYTFVLPDRRLSGAWYVNEVTHTITSRGYETTAQLHKGALNAFGTPKGNRTNVDNKPYNPVLPAISVITQIDAETGTNKKMIYINGKTFELGSSK